MVTSSQASKSSKPNIPDDIAKQYLTYSGLATDDKLGLLWVLYENMGGSITPAAPGAAEPQFTQSLLNDVKAMEQSDQLTFMRDLVERKKTDQTEVYSGFTENNKLVFWYELSQGMTNGEIIPVPDDYELPSSAAQSFNDIAALDFEQQITLLRHAAVAMGV